ncbi:hypothetical protein HDU89_003261 [Geranomyces variabilis]|nr:hypothetical protein HDU89_003261 [Geranomyces variabilis]
MLKQTKHSSERPSKPKSDLDFTRDLTRDLTRDSDRSLASTVARTPTSTTSLLVIFLVSLSIMCLAIDARKIVSAAAAIVSRVARTIVGAGAIPGPNGFLAIQMPRPPPWYAAPIYFPHEMRWEELRDTEERLHAATYRPDEWDTGSTFAAEVIYRFLTGIGRMPAWINVGRSWRVRSRNLDTPRDWPAKGGSAICVSIWRSAMCRGSTLMAIFWRLSIVTALTGRFGWVFSCGGGWRPCSIACKLGE